jgi:hypothetical protein
MHFDMKSYLKNTYNHTAKHVLRWWNKNSIYFVTLFTRETSYQEDCIVSYPSIVLYASTLASKLLSVKITLSKLLCSFFHSCKQAPFCQKCKFIQQSKQADTNFNRVIGGWAAGDNHL